MIGAAQLDGIEGKHSPLGGESILDLQQAPLGGLGQGHQLHVRGRVQQKGRVAARLAIFI